MEDNSKIVNDENGKDTEINEAIAAGEKALESLEDARDVLKNAHSWGTFDMFFGGFFTSMIKQDKMLYAKGQIENAKRDLEKFSDEPSDIDMSSVNLETGDGLGTVDLFFDNIFADVMMQGRIEDALRSVEDAINKVNDILPRLRASLEEK